MRLVQLIRSTLLVIMSIALAACTSMRIVPTGPSAKAAAESQNVQALVPGDVIKIKLRDGNSFEFILAKISDSELQGIRSGATGNEVVKLQDVDTVERKQFDALKTTLLIVFVVAGIYFVAQALLVTKLLGSA